MTRTERLAATEARTKARLDAERTRLAQVRSAQKAVALQARTKRRYQIGALADAAGLCDLSDADLAGLFALLATLAHGPGPVAVLASLLSDREGPDPGAVPGMADLRSCGPYGTTGQDRAH
jgi:hypothetical protein